MLFSIITVCFNSAKTIRQTFDSVLQQEFKDYEYIVVDGASTDGTVEIIKEYEPKFEGRMRWISEPDKGIYDAMNKGIDLSKGEYLNFLNTGDYYEKDTLDKIEKTIKCSPCFDLYYGITRIFDDQGEESLSRRYHSRIVENQVINQQAVWYCRSVFEQYGTFDTVFRICADYDNMLTLFEKGCFFCPVDAIVVNYKSGGISDQAFLNGETKEEHLRIKIKHGIISQQDYDAWLKRKQWEETRNKIFAFIAHLFLFKLFKKIILTVAGK